jgi:hypothetical protein
MLLYKYFRPYQKQNDNRIVAEDLLKRLLIRFTQPTEFDDPFDCLPQVEGLENPDFFKRLFKKSAAEFRETHHFDDLPLEEKIFREGRLNAIGERKVQLDISNSEKWENAYLDSLKARAHSQIGILCLAQRFSAGSTVQTNHPSPVRDERFLRTVSAFPAVPDGTF